MLEPNFLDDKLLCSGLVGIRDDVGGTSFCVITGLLIGSFGFLHGILAVELSQDRPTLVIQFGICLLRVGF